MTHEQVKQVIEWLAQTGYIQISINPKQVEIIANDFIEAHPTTPPQDLRERAVAIITEASNKDWQTEEQAKDLTINAMLQFASEVSAEKDRRIAELQHMEYVNLQSMEYARNRIAELEAEVKRLNEKISKMSEYIGLLTDELNDVVPMASVHGWKSNRFEAGQNLRDQIKSLDK